MTNTKLHPAEQYAQQVRNKEILTCELVQLAVERYYRDQDNAFDKGQYFDRKAAVRAITFIERLKHTKGEWAGQRFRLEPWQQFIITIAGFNKNGACYAYRDNVVKVLRWMLASTVIKTDPAGNIKPDKEKSVQKIDVIVASIMALGEWMTAQAAKENNPYSKRGMLSFNE